MKLKTIRDMKHNSLKRIMLTLVVMLAFAVTAAAQQGLHVDNVFKRFGHAKGCKMVEMHDAKLRGYELKVYKRRYVKWWRTAAW